MGKSLSIIVLGMLLHIGSMIYLTTQNNDIVATAWFIGLMLTLIGVHKLNKLNHGKTE